MTQRHPAFDHNAFMAVWRSLRDPDGRKIVKAEYELVMSAIEGKWKPPAAARPSSAEPKWLTEGRRFIGQREIPGPQHNSWIAKGWARLGAPWYNDDETPWCGFFVAHCIDAAGLPYPGKGEFARAKAWMDWGKASQPVVGAVAVFGRTGGGHVGLAVGESAGHIYVLGGNQSNMVNIAPIAKGRLLGFRWPLSVPAGTTKLPPMSGGTVSSNEA